MDHLILQTIRFYHFSLPLKRSFFVNGAEIKQRDGVIVHIISDKGYMGFGESTPLPGLSAEPLKKTVHQLDLFKKDLTGIEVSLEKNSLLRWLGMRFSYSVLTPSVIFGLTSAILSLAAHARGVSVAEFLGGPSPKPLLTASLLQGSLNDVLAQAANLKANGQRIFELKVGNRNIPLDVQKIDRLRDLLGPGVMLRLDADGQWSLKEALVFARSIGKAQIDFIEEPCADIGTWNVFYKTTDLPYAAGKSLPLFSEDMFEQAMGLKTLIVAPMIRGGIISYLDLLDKARDAGRKVVVQSAFESGLGLAFLANLAALTGEPAGLGSGDWLETDLLSEPLTTPAGMVLASKFALHPQMFHRAFHRQLKAT